ncbi:uncharacterized protein B0H18DRAFT_605272 [Fomitopsis serialis]|uniref:uncharacterized protein n=1 Tax=Fomitopsis serialis TaxID=139415 RepID=UPI0020075598|nr:uncharacterized protein B0H18DRAFT_605272 [Neoantrodia serialis]KAH9933899.1 hypothetical protein B0H18DRAFT_605272 [Neoantrodia serialis]
MGEYDSTYGAAHLGVCIACILYGVTNLQTFLYFRTFPDDKLWHKVGVFWLWFLDTVHIVLCVYMVYYYVITEFGNEFALLTLNWSIKAQLIVEALVISSAQTLYTIRIWKRNSTSSLTSNESEWSSIVDASIPRELGDRGSKYRIVPGIVIVALLSGYACSLVFCYEIPRHSYIADFFGRGLWITYYADINAAVVDAVIAGALCYLLARCRTGYTRMDSTLGWLMFYILNTGVITCICAVITVIMVKTLPYTFGVIAAQVIQTKLYVNSYLALTNARSSLRLQNHRRALSIEYMLRPIGPPSTSRRSDNSINTGKDPLFPEESHTAGSNARVELSPVLHRNSTIYIGDDKKATMAEENV